MRDASEEFDPGFKPGDHVCAFYDSRAGSHVETVASYVSLGLGAGDKCICFVDDAEAVLASIGSDVDESGDQLVFMEPDGWYVPEERFSAAEHLARLDTIVASVFTAGYAHARLVGDASFVFRRAVDPKEWFAYEAEVNTFAGRYPQYLLCLYDLDCFDGSLVVAALRTHPLMLVNGMVLKNPYYASPDDYLAGV